MSRAYLLFTADHDKEAAIKRYQERTGMNDPEIEVEGGEMKLTPVPNKRFNLSLIEKNNR